MRANSLVVVICCLVVHCYFSNAQAEFTGLSGLPDPGSDSVAAGGNPADVALSLAHGFPLWVMDSGGRKIAPCLSFGPIIDIPPSITDPGELLTLPGVNHFCTAEALFLNPALPVVFNGGVFPENFPELFPFYSMVAEKTGDFNADGLQDGLILVDSSLSGGFVGEIPADGDQIMIAETFVRLRNLPSATGYRLVTPYGSYTFDILAGGTDVRFHQTVQSLEGGDFLRVLNPAPAALVIRDAANLDTDPGSDIDVFHAWRPAEIQAYNTAFQNAFTAPPSTPGVGNTLDDVFSPIRNADGDEVGRQRYLAVAQAETPHIVPGNYSAAARQTVFDGSGALTVVLIPPAGVSLQGQGQEGAAITIDTFSLQGKRFHDGPNTAPVSVADSGFVPAGSSALLVKSDGTPLDVVENDLDDPSSTNLHGIDPQAVSAVDFDQARIGAGVGFSELPSNAAGSLLVAAPVTTERGGVVRRSIDRSTGRSRFLYTPPAGPDPTKPFSGQDRFLYVVQDAGGLLSTTAPVTIHVEAISTSIEYRPKNGRWTISGVTSEPTVPDPQNPGERLPNRMSIYKGDIIAPDAIPIATAIVRADGTWLFRGKLPISPDSPITIRSAGGTPLTSVRTQLK